MIPTDLHRPEARRESHFERESHQMKCANMRCTISRGECCLMSLDHLSNLPLHARPRPSSRSSFLLSLTNTCTSRHCVLLLDAAPFHSYFLSTFMTRNARRGRKWSAHACGGGHSVADAAAVLAFAINCRHISPREFSTCQTVLSSCSRICVHLLAFVAADGVCCIRKIHGHNL